MEIVEVVDVQQYTEPYEQKRNHKLLPDDVVLPKPHTQQSLSDDKAIAYLKFVANNGWEWYVLEYDGKDKFYGLVYGFALERGYFSLNELASIETDAYKGYEPTPAVTREQSFQPMPLDQIIERVKLGYRWKWIMRDWSWPTQTKHDTAIALAL